MSPFSRIVGLGVSIFFFLFAFLFNGGHLGDLIYPGEMTIILAVPLGLIMARFGFIGLRECLSLPARLLQAKTISTETEQIYQCWIKATYIVSVLGFVLGILGIIVTMQFIPADLAVFSAKIAAATSSFIYAIGLCEFLIRPTINNRR